MYLRIPDFFKLVYKRSGIEYINNVVETTKNEKSYPQKHVNKINIKNIDAF